PIVLGKPWRWIPVEVGGAQNDKAESDGGTKLEQELPSSSSLQLHEGAKQISCGHYSDPRDKRIKDIQGYPVTEGHQTGFMQNVPSRGAFSKLFGCETIEQIVAGEHNKTHARYGPAR